MEVKPVFSKHPYATMVTAVFFVSIVITTMYYFRLIPGVPQSRPKLGGLLTTTVILLVTTVVSWVTAFVMRPDGHDSEP